MFKIYLLNSANYPTEIYNDNNVYDPIVFEPELEMNGDNGVLIGKLSLKLHEPSYSPQLRLLQNTVIVTQMIAGVETVIFRGRPLLRDDDEYNDQDFTFEGILAGLNDTLQAPSNKRGLGFYEHFKTIMDWHNNQVQDYANNRQIDYSKISKTDPTSYMCTITETDPVGILWESMLEYTRSRASSMEHIKTQYVDAHGGCFYLENEPLVYDADGCIVLHNYLKYIDIYNPDQAHVNGQQIEFGKNLISIKRSASADDFATVLIPLGKQLTDLEKSWPYYQSTDNNKIRKIVSSPDNAEIVNYAVTGAYINSETGAVVSGIGSAYVIPGDVDVEYGDVFYLTTYLEGISTNTSIAAYAVMSRDGQRVFSVGLTVRNSNDSTGKIVLKDERIEIPTPEDDTIQLKLRTAYMISANDPNGGFVLKKFNANYQEDNVTIMSADPQTTGTIRKTGQYAIGRDVYPDATDTPTAPESYEQSKRLVNQDLFDIFGPIEKSIELPDYGTDKIKDLVYWGSLNLERMGEDLEIEIQAADLSYIDESQEPFQPFDLVPVESSPHILDMMLPIVKMTLPLADPASATYTLQNDIHLSEDSKKYISQMVSSPGSTGQKNQTVVIYGGRGGSGGGGSAVGAVLYNMPQSLNEAQKAQARSNIGVGSGGGIDYPPFTSDDSGKSLHIIGETVQWNQYYVTPEQFGAYGDGDQPNPHDDTAAIQAAFDAAANGGTVKFGLKKTYLVSKENGGTAYTTGNTHPVIMHYMLRIHGSITILGNGSTIKEPEITQAVYDAEYPIRNNTEIRNSASMIWLDNSERRSSAAADNSAEINDRNYVIIRGLVLDGNCHVDRNLDHGGGAGAWWKAIYANDTSATYLELNSVTIRDFAAEGVYAQVSSGSKFRAFGCTFENCTPSAWNCGGSLAEAIGCTFNCTDPTNHASEYVSQKTIFDSCTFNTEAMRPILLQGKAGTELIVRNSIFNTSSTVKPILTIYTVYYDGGFTAEKYWQSGTVYLFARSSGNTFALATELQDGQDFLIVNVDSGSGYALAKNTDGSLKSVAVTISNNSVTLSDTSAVWVCSTNTNGFVLKNYEQTVVPSDSEDEGGEQQGDLVDAYLTCNATKGLLTASSFASTRWWNYSKNQLKLRITPPQYLPTIYTRDSQNVFIDSCVFNNLRATDDEEANVTTKSLSYGKINNCTFNRTTMNADSIFNVLFVGQAQNNIVRVTNYPTYPDGASIIGRGLSIRLTGRSKYKFNMISAPRTFTIAPSENCTLVAWGFGTRVINVNVPVYAHARATFNVDYSSLPSAPYYNEYFSAMQNFFVECDKPFSIIIET